MTYDDLVEKYGIENVQKLSVWAMEAREAMEALRKEAAGATGYWAASIVTNATDKALSSFPFRQ